jgi:hypothetical protein
MYEYVFNDAITNFALQSTDFNALFVSVSLEILLRISVMQTQTTRKNPLNGKYACLGIYTV